MLSITRKIRNVKRLAEIAAVLIRHGFRDVVQTLGVERLLEHGAFPDPCGRPADGGHLTRQVRLRKAMEELGPTFIKLGQVLSVRPDLVPPEWADEFKHLQTECPEIPFAAIRAEIESAFPGRVDRIYSFIDPKPLAAGSMAQVHRGRLADGRQVVIKVLRPGVRTITATDMALLGPLARLAERHLSDPGFSPTEVVREFARELRKEVDLAHEGRATERLRNCFAGDDGVVFPEVFWQATGETVLTLEEIVGIQLAHLQPGQLTPEERRSVVANGTRAVLRQCLDVGFFHADPHPGNLFALPGGRIGFIDCGMTGQLDGRTTALLADLMFGVVAGDVDRVMDTVLELADADPDRLDDRMLRSDLSEVVSRFESSTFERLDMGAVLSDLFEVLRAHRIRCPGDLVLLLKAVTTIEAVGASLDPSFDLVTFAKPHIERLLARRYGAGALAGRLRDGALSYAQLAESLPGDVRRLLTQIRRRRLSIGLELREVAKLTGSIEHAAKVLGTSLILAALMIGAALLVLANRDPAAFGFSLSGVAVFAAAALMSLRFVLRNRKGPER